MTYLKVNSKVPKNFTNRATSLAVATLLITSMFIWAIPITPAYAAANASLTLSSSTAPWYKTSDHLIQVLITDPDYANNAASNETLTVTVTQKNAAGGVVTNDVNILAQENGNSGQFFLYLRGNGSSAAPTNAPTTPVRYWTASVHPVEDGSVTISYLDASGPTTISKTVSVTNVNTDVTTDRVQYPPAGILHINATDPDLNADPTALDSWTLDVDISALLANGTAKSTTAVHVTFNETDVNSGNFANTNTTMLTGDWNDTLGIDTFVNGDLVTLTVHDPVIAGSDKGSASFDIMTESGVLVLPASFTYSGNLKLQVVDFDRNLDSQVKDSANMNTTLVEILNINNGTRTDYEYYNLTETDVNTDTFSKTASVTWNYNWSAPAPLNGDLEIRCGERAKVTYMDPSTNSNTSIIYTPLSCLDPELTPSTTAVGPGNSLQLSLLNPNSNDDKDARSTLTSSEDGDTILEVGDSLGSVKLNSSGLTVGEMRIRVMKGGVGSWNTAAVTGSSFSIVFRETGDDTGVYELTTELDTTKISDGAAGSLEDGDKVEIRYKDLIDPDNPTSTVTITISAAGATVTLDRSTYPVGRGLVKVHVSIADADMNANPNSIEEIVLGDNETPRVLKINNQMLLNLASGGNIMLEETAPNSGVFETTISIDQTLTDSRVWINSKVQIDYFDESLGENVTVTATFHLNDIAITADKTTASYGDDFTVTVTDHDSNFDSTVKDKINVNVTYTNLSGATTIETYSATETGVNTGVFTKKLSVGDDFLPKIGTTIKLSAKDDTSITAAPTDDASAVWPASKEVTFSITTSTATAVMNIQPSGQFGPGTKVNVTISDFDANDNIEIKDTVTFRVKTNTVANGVTFTATETAISSGVFTAKVQVGGTNADINATVGDLAQFVYLDEHDSSGNARSIVITCTVISNDPMMMFEQPSYVPDDVATVVITDFDANLDPDLPDSIPVQITSDSDPIGLALTAWENDSNTGIFTVSFTLKSTVIQDTLFVALGDTLTASYKDQAPADYPTTEKAKTFTVSALVGSPLPPTQRVPASTPEVVTTTGAPVTAPTAGSLVIVQSTVTNNDTEAQTFTFIVQIKNANGIVVYLNWIQNIPLDPGASATPGVSWTPAAAGTYTIEVFVWDSLTGASALSPTFTQTVTVS